MIQERGNVFFTLLHHNILCSYKLFKYKPKNGHGKKEVAKKLPKQKNSSQNITN